MCETFFGCLKQSRSLEQGSLRVSSADVIDAPLDIVPVSLTVDVVVQGADHLRAIQLPSVRMQAAGQLQTGCRIVSTGRQLMRCGVWSEELLLNATHTCQ